jgi:predicted transcriptional regulator
MLVSEIMTRELFTVQADLTVADGLFRAQERDVHHLLLVHGKQLKGVVCVCQLRDRPPNEPLARSIDGPPMVIWAQSTLKHAARRFVEKGASCFPVCDGEVLVGVLTRGDLRRSVIPESLLPGSFRCKFCGSTRHVRPLRGDTSQPACLDCTDRASAALHEHFDEGVKD